MHFVAGLVYVALNISLQTLFLNHSSYAGKELIQTDILREWVMSHLAFLYCRTVGDWGLKEQMERIAKVIV